MTGNEPRQLVEWRTARAWSGRYLAERASVAPSTIVRIERGLPARAESFRQIAEALGIEPLAIREYADQVTGGRNETTAQD